MGGNIVLLASDYTGVILVTKPKFGMTGVWLVEDYEQLVDLLTVEFPIGNENPEPLLLVVILSLIHI